MARRRTEGGPEPRTSFVILWEFHVAPGREREFLAAYGPSGTWASLFHRAPGYIETLLLQDEASPGRFLTVDRWSCPSAFDVFRIEYRAEYAALDATCEGLALRETPLGSYREVGEAAV